MKISGQRPDMMVDLLSFDTAGGEAGDKVLFDEHEEDDNGDRGQKGGSEQVVPLDHGERGKLC